MRLLVQRRQASVAGPIGSGRDFSSWTSCGIHARMGTTVEPEESRREFLELTRRFERLLSAIDGHKRPLNRRESFHFQNFLELLKQEQWREADAALRRAEQVAPIPAQFADLQATNIVVGTSELRTQLARIIAGE